MKPIEEGGGGLKQTPETFGAINLGNLDADPSTATSNIGDVYYNTTNNTIKALFTDSLGGLSWNNVAYGINIDKTQVVGTAVTLADSGTITSAMIGNTQVTLSKLSTGSVNNSKIATNADIDPTKIAGTAAILGANTFTDQQTITPATSVTALVVNAASSAVGLSVRYSGTGTVNVIQAVDSGGTNALWSVNQGGTVYSAGRLIVRTDYSATANVGVGSSTQVGMIIRAASGQTADIQQWQTSDAISVAYMTSGGALYLNDNNLSVADNVGLKVKRTGLFDSGGTTIVPIIARGRATQSADLQQWQDSGSAVRAQVSSAGAFTISPSSGTALTVNGVASGIGLVVQPNASGADVARFYHTNASVFSAFSNAGNLIIRTSNASWSPSAALQVDTSNVTLPGVIVQGDSGQTADLQRWQTKVSGTTVMGGRNAVAQLWSGSTTPIYGSGATITQTVVTAGTNVVYTTSANHNYGVGDLVQITGITTAQGLPATNPVSITAVTSTTFTAAVTTGTSGTYTSLTGSANIPAQASITPRSAATKGIVVRGAASQVTNLQEWQSSDTSIVAAITSAGSLRIPVLMAQDGNTVMVFAGGGRNFGILTASASYGGGSGVMFVGNATTVPSTNPTGGGILYAEGGALKWRGSSGTITTIANA